MDTDADFIVVGAGPSGSHAASELCLLGHKVLVLERKVEPGLPICCTGLISLGCFHEFGLPFSLVQRWHSAGRVIAPGGEYLEVRRSEPQAASVNRGSFDSFLNEKAIASGAVIAYGSRVDAIEINPNGVVVKVNADSHERKYSAKAVVLASGYSSLTQQLDIGQVETVVFGAQQEILSDRVNDVVEVFCSSRFTTGFFAWFVPLDSNRVRIGLITRKQPQVHLEHFCDFLSVSGRVTQFLESPAFRRIPLGVANKTYSERVVVIGDACGQTKPLTGGGIYYGLKAAHEAASSLHEADCKNDFSARQLSSYEKAWKKAFGKDIKLSRMVRSIYERLDDTRLDAFIHLAKNSRTIESLLTDDRLTFDSHGAVILAVLKSRLFGDLHNGIEKLGNVFEVSGGKSFG